MNELLLYFGEQLQFELILPDALVEKHGRGPGTKPRRFYGSIEKYRDRFAKMNEQGWGVYFTVNHSSKPMERKAAFMTRARAVWIEDDGDDKGGATDPSTFPISPSAVVQSSPGKYHYYWFTSTQDMVQWQQVMDSMTAAYGGDIGGKLITQVLRVPGFANTKPSYNMPLVSIDDGHFKTYAWDEITKAFPPMDIGDGPDKVYPDNAREVFEMGKVIDELLEGDVIYPSCMRIAASLVNKGHNRRDIHAFVSVLLSRVGPCDGRETRIKEAQAKLYQGIDDAIGKYAVVKNSYMFSDDLGSPYTELDWPPGRMGVLSRWVYDQMPWWSKEIAIAAAFTVASAASACYHYNGKGMSRARTILAPNGRGKESASEAITRLLEEISVPIRENIMMEEAHSPFNYQADMNQFAVRVMINSEAGLILGTTSGDQASKAAWKLDALGCNIGGKALKVVEGSRRNSQNLEKALPVKNPVFILLDESTPETYLPAAEKAIHKENGLLARTELFFISPEYGFNHSHWENHGVTPELKELFTAMFAQLQESKVGQMPLEKSSIKNFIQADFSKVIDKMTELSEQNLAQRVESTGNPLSRALIVRYNEKVTCTALAMAALDSCDTQSPKPSPPTVTDAHFDYAVKYHNEQVRATRANAQKGVMASAVERGINKLYEDLLRIVKGKESATDKATMDGEFITLQWLNRKFRSDEPYIARTMQQHHNMTAVRARYMLMEEAIGKGLVQLATGHKDKWINLVKESNQ